MGEEIGGEQVLAGGVGNAGQVVRIGESVRRPWQPSAGATHALLTHLDQMLPGAAPLPLGRDEQGREVLSWIEGDVGLSPFPGWVCTDEFLSSLGGLLRRVHDALDGWQPPAASIWSEELRDPHGGPVITHADIRPDNIVARGGRAAAIIDWEFAAPGRRIWDVVSAARHCVPFTEPSRRDPAFRDYGDDDLIHRLRVFLDAYRPSAEDRAIFTEVLDERRIAGERFVRGRISRGEPAFVDKWDNAEGASRLRAERDWVAAVPSDVASDIAQP